ncbi:hypothetical protein LEN26_014204 [Aphanomyces euteiches]|nr:hypothetical protein LEN26_014204 [Aphanomyces euteiches]KAH9126170.1 hypothetical protein AeMF1_003369 [Aphanomyces euteiches]
MVDPPTETMDVLYAKWNAPFAAVFTETANKSVTIQAASELHRHMELDRATSVLEVASGAGIGSLDILKYLESSTAPSKRFRITDFSPAMIELAKQNVNPAKYEFPVDIELANGQDLVNVTDGSVDRYIASFVLQMAPDPEAMLQEAYRVLDVGGIAGFVIWGRPEESGWFTILHNIEPDAVTNWNNFYMGQDIPKLRETFKRIGFSSVLAWTKLCVAEKWSAARHADYVASRNPKQDKDAEAAFYAKVLQASQEWLDSGKPIGLETYLILAKK